MTYELQNGLTLGAVEEFLPQHEVRSQGKPAITKLAIELEWISNDTSIDAPYMRSPIVRGAPYTTMIYSHASPRIYVERFSNKPLIIDGEKSGKTLECGTGHGVFSKESVVVNRELKVQFDTSDMTWLVFVSEPTEFVCSQMVVLNLDYDSHPGVVVPHDPAKCDFFELKSVRPMNIGIVRVAVANNCTTGQNAERKNAVVMLIIFFF
jgi:hypothetical protein